jgi:hypothetical protein
MLVSIGEFMVKKASGSVKARELLTFTLAVDLFKNILNGIMKY